MYGSESLPTLPYIVDLVLRTMFICSISTATKGLMTVPFLCSRGLCYCWTNNINVEIKCTCTVKYERVLFSEYNRAECSVRLKSLYGWNMLWEDNYYVVNLNTFYVSEILESFHKFINKTESLRNNGLDPPESKINLNRLISYRNDPFRCLFKALPSFMKCNENHYNRTYVKHQFITAVPFIASPQGNAHHLHT